MPMNSGLTAASPASDQCLALLWTSLGFHGLSQLAAPASGGSLLGGGGGGPPDVTGGGEKSLGGGGGAGPGPWNDQQLQDIREKV